ncbi:MAG TPA: phenylacetate--CoA ligase [Lachnospiraceae bacterium]|nr:phenylacetate--CoA ligase [Lachnospiraceae bacterium]
MIWNKLKECMSRDELLSLQGKHLVKLVKYMYQNVTYYREKMQKLGMEPEDICGIEDLGKLPFTTKEDLIAAYPSGIFAIPERKIARYHSSDNLIGPDRIVGYTKKDIDHGSECVARSISMANLGKKDVIQIMYNYAPFSEGLSAHYGAERVGATIVPSGIGRTLGLPALMKKLHVTGIMGTPTYLLRLAQIVEDQGLKGMLNLKTVLCGAEPWTEKVRRTIQEKLGVKAYDLYGLNELTGLGVACECECQKGMHVQEDYFLAEILDTNTLAVLPDGINGELIFTTLQKEGLPLVRYRTMHFTKIHYEKCDCGRTMARIDRIGKEMPEALMICGKSVLIKQIEEALCNLPTNAVSYTIHIRREHKMDVAEIFVNCSADNLLLTERQEDIRQQIAKVFSNLVGVIPAIYFEKNIGELSNNKHKKVVIIDERV